MASFITSYPIMTKFSVIIEFDKLSPKSLKEFIRMTSLWSYEVIFCFKLLYLLKFLNSLFLD